MAEQPPIETIVRDSNRVSGAEARALVAELRAGGDAAWNAPTKCEGWAAKDAVAHLVRGLTQFAVVTRATLDGQPPPPFDPTQAEAATAQLLQQPRDMVLTLLQERNDDYTEYLDGLDVAALPTPVNLGWGIIPVWQVAVGRLNELAIHSWDVRAGRQPDARIRPDAVPILLEVLIGTAGHLARGEKRDGTWQIDLDGRPVSVRVAGDQDRVERRPAASPDVRVAMDGEAFVRLVWGRFDLAPAIDSGRVRVDGDRDRALALQRLFPGA